MVTSSDVEFNVEITGVNYQIAPSGNLNAIMRLKPSQFTEKYNLNALIFSSLIECSELGLGIGAKGSIKLNTEDNSIKYTPSKRKTMPPAPLKCPVCQSTLSIPKEPERVCKNVYCAGTSKGYIYRLIYKAKGDKHENLYTDFVEKFVINNTITSIDTIEEFLYLFLQKGLFIFTPMNLKEWEEHHPLNGKRLWELENLLLEYLQSKFKSKEDFWFIAGFPSISKEDFEKLKNVHPIELDLKGTNNNIKKAVNVNKDFIEWLVKFFKAFQVGIIWE